MEASTEEGVRPSIGYACKKVIVVDYASQKAIRPKIVTKPKLSQNVTKKLNMANERERLAGQITINTCIMRLLQLNPKRQQLEEPQSNSKQSLELEQKRAQTNREGVTGDPMPLLQVELELRAVPVGKIISHETTRGLHLKTSKGQWSLIRTLWQFRSQLQFPCGTLRVQCHRNAIITGKYPTVPLGQALEINNNDNHKPHPTALPQPIL